MIHDSSPRRNTRIPLICSECPKQTIKAFIDAKADGWIAPMTKPVHVKDVGMAIVGRCLDHD